MKITRDTDPRPVSRRSFPRVGCTPNLPEGPMSFQIPEHVRPVRDAVLTFIEEEVYPVEQLLE